MSNVRYVILAFPRRLPWPTTHTSPITANSTLMEDLLAIFCVAPKCTFIAPRAISINALGADGFPKAFNVEFEHVRSFLC